MKFLCDSCKAKYQIADEKVAGKTVRMKCRKCGHLIEIRAGQALREPSAMLGLPAEELSQIYGEPGLVDAKAPSTPAPAAAPAPTAAAPRPAAGVASAAAKKPVATPAPRPAAGSPAGGGLRVAGTGGAAAAKAAPAPSPTPSPAAERAPRPAGGLASAFSKSVTAEAKPKTTEDSGVTRALDLSSAASSEEWYVGISGVPVGPVRLAELRSKAAAGQVTEDSLVWREGFEEWLPLRTFPDLLEMVHSARGQGDMLSTSPPKQGGPLSGGSPSNRPAARAQQPAESKKGGAVISLRPGSDRPEAEAEKPAALEPMSDPFAAPAAPLTTADPFAPPPGAAVVAPIAMAPAAPVVADEAVVHRPPPGRIPVAAWVAIVLALVTGVTAGSVLFSKPPPPPTVQIVTVTAPSPQAPAPTATATEAATAQAEPAVVDPKAEQPGTARKVGGPMPGGAVAAAGTTAAPAKSAAPALGLVGMPGVGGADAPSVGPTPGGGSTGAGPSGGEPLPSNKLQEVVNSNRNSLKRACWEPALNAKGGSGSSARVTVTFTVGRDGRVIRASTAGGDAYPTLGPCIAGRVKGWVFPAGYAETPTSFSLSFVAQGGLERRRQKHHGPPLLREASRGGRRGP